jgi:hypothetical protein
MWFALSLTLTGDASHNSRCGNVSGWRRVFPFASHCLRSARLSSDMRLRVLLDSRFGVHLLGLARALLRTTFDDGVISKQFFDLLVGERFQIDLVGVRRFRQRHACRSFR